MIQGCVHRFGDNIDTDAIVPVYAANLVDPTALGQHCMANIDPHFADRVRPGEILVAGRNFGCGSSREHAPWALQDFGYKVIIAESFADIFRTNCTKIGVLPVTLPGAEIEALIAAATENPDMEIEVDLERRVVLDAHEREIAFEFEGGTRERLLRGWDDISITMEHEDELLAFERDRERVEGPVTLPFA